MKYNKIVNETIRSMLPTQIEINTYLSKFFPEENIDAKLFEDNWGLYSKNRNDIVSKILLCTTATPEVVKYFKSGNFDLLISHHDDIVSVPQIIYHTTMDESPAGHNMYFARKIGLQNVEKKKVTVGGNLPIEMNIDELKSHLEKRGFTIDGLVWKNPRVKDLDTKLKSVIYCSGLGGMLIDTRTLVGMNWLNNLELDLRNNKSDVYITGELVSLPRDANLKFKYVMELGHTSSEKPLFKQIKNILLNRWNSLKIEIATNDIDYFGKDIL